MNTLFKKILQGMFLSSVIFIGSFSFTPVVVFAQTPPNYTVLQPLPGTTGANGVGNNCSNTVNADGTVTYNCTTDLSTYLPGLFKLMIGVAALASFVVITIGGFEYMLSDIPGVKNSSKGMISNALWGLGLIIFAYAILYTVNPALLSGNLNITAPTVASPTASVTVGSGTTTTGSATNVGGNVTTTAMTQAQIAASNTVEAGLAAQGVQTYAGPCTTLGQTTGCVDLNGLQTNTRNGLTAMAAACGTGCVDLSGGTEPGHATDGCHNTGTCVDVLPNIQINSYMNSLGVPTTPSITPVPITINGASASAFYEVTGTGGTSSGAHWHIIFN